MLISVSTPLIVFLLLAAFVLGQVEEQVEQVGPATRTIIITNNCSHKIWPALLTTNDTAPIKTSTGFELAPATKRTVTVDRDWIGRVWGRTNCSFDADGNGHCLLGDCGGKLECKLSGAPPNTLAEFTMTGFAAQSYFDISLVDGYGLDMMIRPHHGDGVGNSPSCVMTSSTNNAISNWCPVDHLVFPPAKVPNDSGAFWYPDDALERPRLSPCMSACAKSGTDEDCCKAEWNSPQKCKPSLFSKKAKMICPDAYSYAYDDLLSTFTVPSGEGFDITFCPAGESTDWMVERGVTAGIAGRGRWRAKVGVIVAAAVLISFVNPF